MNPTTYSAASGKVAATGASQANNDIKLAYERGGSKRVRVIDSIDWRYNPHKYNTVSYAGDSIKGVPHGHGKLTETRTGNTYEGEFKNGAFNGQGIYTFNSGDAEGDRYIGNFVNGVMQGKGTYVYKIGGVAEGTWEDDVFIKGKLTFPNGDYYEGDFDVDGRCTGTMIETTLDEYIYEGKCVHGVACGQGTMTVTQGPHKGDKYVGEFKEGKMIPGLYTHANGTVVVEDMPHPSTSSNVPPVKSTAENSNINGDSCVIL